jgi:hypothetical protein
MPEPLVVHALVIFLLPLASPLLTAMAARPQGPLETLMYLDYLTVVLWRRLSQSMAAVKTENGHAPRDRVRPGRRFSPFWDVMTLLGAAHAPLRRWVSAHATSMRNEGIYSDHNGAPRRAPSVACG